MQAQKNILVQEKLAPFFGNVEVVVVEEERALAELLPPVTREQLGFEAQGPRDDQEFLAACAKSRAWNEERKTARLAEIVETARQVQAETDARVQALVARRERIQARHQELQTSAYCWSRSTDTCGFPVCQASRGNMITGGRGHSWDELSRWERAGISSAMRRVYG